MSSFAAIKLDTRELRSHTEHMGKTATSRTHPGGITGSIRQRIERGGERLWRLEDFRDLPFTAVAQALSRLTREGTIERLSKGVYYRTRETAFGKSRPNPAAIQKLASKRGRRFSRRHCRRQSSGVYNSNRKTGRGCHQRSQSCHANSLATIPSSIRGGRGVGQPLRQRCRVARFSSARRQDQRTLGRETIKKTLALMSEKGQFERLLKISDSEPPRVRAHARCHR